MSGGAGGYQPVLDMYASIAKAQDAGAFGPALAMVYVTIDTMTMLALPAGRSKQNRHDFIAWVNKYLKAEPSCAYQYDGRDVYAARCAVLHTYGSESDMHQEEVPPKQFGYVDDGPHVMKADEPLVLISMAVLVRDLGAAIQSFLKEAASAPDLKARIDGRMPKVLATYSVAHKPEST